MYEYVNGVKGCNVGFAKIALKNQWYKIKIQMKHNQWNGKKIQVYGFVRGEGILHTVCFGQLNWVNGMGEGFFTGNTGEVFQKYRFIDMTGLILCDKEEVEKQLLEKGDLGQDASIRFCATQWEEGEISLGQMDIFSAGKPVKEHVVLQAAQLMENQSGEENLPENFVEAEPLSDTIQLENMVEEERPEEKSYNENQWEEEQEEQELKQVQKDDTGIDNEEYQGEQSLFQEENSKINENDHRLQQTEEKIQPDLAPETIQGNDDSGKEDSDENIWEVFEKRRKVMQIQLEEIKKAKMQETENVWSLGEELLEKYPKMYPFFDSSISESVRIEPKDIGVLPMEFWYLANNSFLLHGYYCYRHLLFMKMKIDQENVYAVGIPGNSNYREKFMANMFGFEQFKTVQKKENAGFGYWWKRIY